MRTLLTVFFKEILDNVRDRRTLVSALIMGPIFGPVMFAFVINLSIDRALDDAETTMELPVIGQQHAPNLMRFLESRNIDIVDGPEDINAAADAVKSGRHDVVLLVPADFGEQLADTIPATVELYSDEANSQGEKEARRTRSAIRAYNQQLAMIRLSARGVNPRLLSPINIDEVDVSTPSGRSAMLLGMMSYFFIFALLMGGMYLAIDTTAGERERGSLEPLLSLPVTRGQLILGFITQPDRVLRGLEVHAPGEAWHDAQFRLERCRGRIFSFAALHSAWRIVDDPRGVVYKELQRGANLVECRVDSTHIADSGG